MAACTYCKWSPSHILSSQAYIIYFSLELFVCFLVCLCITLISLEKLYSHSVQKELPWYELASQGVAKFHKDLFGHKDWRQIWNYMYKGKRNSSIHYISFFHLTSKELIWLAKYLFRETIHRLDVSVAAKDTQTQSWWRK